MGVVCVILAVFEKLQHVKFVIVARHVTQIQRRIPRGPIVVDMDSDIVCGLNKQMVIRVQSGNLLLSSNPSSMAILGCTGFAPLTVFCFLVAAVFALLRVFLFRVCAMMLHR